MSNYDVEEVREARLKEYYDNAKKTRIALANHFKGERVAFCAF